MAVNFNERYKIRPVRLHDVEQLHQRCFPANTLQWARELVARARQIALQGRGLGIVAVGVADDLPFAYGQLTIWTRSAEISDLSVMEVWRGQGVGTALIDYCYQMAKDSHVQEVEIGALTSNKRALALYQRLGFVESHILNLDDGQQVQYLKMTIA